MNVREILQAASAYISENGHNKGALYSWDGKLAGQKPAACALGAIRSVLDDSDILNYFPAAMRLADYLKRECLTGPDWQQQNPSALVPAWNDRWETSAEEVILALKKAAEE
jgi:hypothetical protein